MHIVFWILPESIEKKYQIAANFQSRQSATSVKPKIPYEYRIHHHIIMNVSVLFLVYHRWFGTIYSVRVVIVKGAGKINNNINYQS